MAVDTYGAIQLPPQAPTDGPAPSPTLSAVTDPGMDVFLAFIKAVANSDLADAWHMRTPNEDPIGQVFNYNPEGPPFGFFNDRKTAALYGYRKPGTPPHDLSEEWRVVEDAWTFLWVPPERPQERSGPFAAFVAGLGKVIDEAVWLGRHPAYQKSGDTDTKALDIAALPTAIKLAIASSTSAQSYTGAQLDGSIGVGKIDPLRAVTVTLGGTAAAFTPGTTITVSGTNPLGLTQSDTFLILTGADTFTSTRGYSYVTSVAVQAQAATTGTVSVGLAAFTGRGTVLLPALGASLVQPLKQAAWRNITIRQRNGPALLYPAIEFSYRVREVRLRTIESLDDASASYSSLDEFGDVFASSTPQ